MESLNNKICLSRRSHVWCRAQALSSKGGRGKSVGTRLRARSQAVPETFTVTWLATRHITSALRLTFNKDFHAWALISLFDRKIYSCPTIHRENSVKRSGRPFHHGTGSAAFVSGEYRLGIPPKFMPNTEGHLIWSLI